MTSKAKKKAAEDGKKLLDIYIGLHDAQNTLAANRIDMAESSTSFKEITDELRDVLKPKQPKDFF